MRAKLQLLGVLASLASLGAQAHGDEPHEPEVAAPVIARSDGDRPRRLDDGSLYLPQRVQQLLDIRTEVVPDQPPLAVIPLIGEVLPDPSARGGIRAPEVGRLEAPDDGWPLAGQKVQKGATLAYLVPVIAQREVARRRAEVAKIERDLEIARVDVERLRVQSAANDGEPTGNVYYDQALAQLQTLQRQRELLLASISARVTITSPISGVLAAVPVRAGDVASTGQPLFEVVDPTHLRVVATTFDPQLASRAGCAHAHIGDEMVMFTVRGREPLAKGWRLLLDAAAAPHTTVMPGEIIQLSLHATNQSKSASSAWIRVAPEIFALRAPSAGNERVTQGAALLSQYR